MPKARIYIGGKFTAQIVRHVASPNLLISITNNNDNTCSLCDARADSLGTFGPAVTLVHLAYRSLPLERVMTSNKPPENINVCSLKKGIRPKKKQLKQFINFTVQFTHSSDWHYSQCITGVANKREKTDDTYNTMPDAAVKTFPGAFL